MQFALLCIAVLAVVVKLAATIWLVRQPDATTVTATRFGHAVYLAGKVTPTLFVAALLARSWLQGAPSGYLLFLAIALVVAIVMAAIVMRQRARGEWYGLAHDIHQKRWRD